MIDATLPLGGAVLLPVLAAAVAACLPHRARPWLGVLASLTTLVVVVLAVVSNLTGSVQTELGGWTPPLGIGLRLTGPGALLILITALVGTAISLYAAALPAGTGGPAFWPLWLGCWAGLNAVYVSDDLFNIYVALEVVTLAAIALVALGGPPAWSAAFRYLMIGVVGAMLFLLAVGLIFAQTGTLELHAATDSLGGTTAALAVSLAATGLALKVALMPLHGWLIPAHSAAPAAVSPLLSALVVKASLYVLWELVLLLPQAGALLAWVLGALGYSRCSAGRSWRCARAGSSPSSRTRRSRRPATGSSRCRSSSPTTRARPPPAPPPRRRWPAPCCSCSATAWPRPRCS